MAVEYEVKDAMINQSEDDPALVAALSAVVRQADRDFERVGGGTRHWVRDCFLPLLNQNGFVIAPDPGVVARGVAASLLEKVFQMGWHEGFQEALRPDEHPDQDRCAVAFAERRADIEDLTRPTRGGGCNS